MAVAPPCLAPLAPPRYAFAPTLKQINRTPFSHPPAPRPPLAHRSYPLPRPANRDQPQKSFVVQCVHVAGSLKTKAKINTDPKDNASQEEEGAARGGGGAGRTQLSLSD